MHQKPQQSPSSNTHEPPNGRGVDNHGHNHTPGAEGRFFMKPLTRAPDYRFNLYVEGLDPSTSARQLFSLFEPYGQILACRVNHDTVTGLCRGGFVLYDNRDSCNQARKELTLQGLYVAVADESACIKNLPPAQSVTREVKPEVPQIDNSEVFPSLPSNHVKKISPTKKKKKRAKKAVKAAPSQAEPFQEEPFQEEPSQAAPSTTTSDSSSNQLDFDESPPLTSSQCEPEREPDQLAALCQLDDPASGNDGLEISHGLVSSQAPDLGRAYLDFDSGFIGSHHDILRDSYHSPAAYAGRTSFLDKPFFSVDDIDRYMKELQFSEAAAPTQAHENRDWCESRRLNKAHISNTTFDDFVQEEHPRQESTLHFEDLADGLTFQELFEKCSLYGSLILSSVDIRYINEECSGQARVTFQSFKESKIALADLIKKYNVRHGDSMGLYPNETSIDEALYEQYYQQHQKDLLQSATCGSPEEMDWQWQHHEVPSSAPNITPPMPPATDFSGQEGSLSTFVSQQHGSLDSGLYVEHNNLQFNAFDSLRTRHEILSALGVPNNSLPSVLEHTNSSCLSPTNIASEKPLPGSSNASNEHASLQEVDANDPQLSDLSSQDNARSPGPSKMPSYSDVVKVPAKHPVYFPIKDQSLYQDLKRRGNTNTHLDDKEYGLNLFLRNLEPTMNEFKLYDICVQTITTGYGVCIGLGFVMFIGEQSASRAIKGLAKLGYYAEVAVQSATDKLRCKALSDLLFIQNIPPHIKEGKVKHMGL
ncbi:Uncharacterized protein EDD11_010106 [Mortierella claussenii]|nr:Uncharacterized protein EDD11_010106 [Mortierella claussenii]